jgi:hypothetical protein
LDSSEDAAREQAEGQLGRLEDLAQPQLRKALAEKVSLEVRRRAEQLLTKLDASPPSAKTLQGVRAIETLERMTTSEARPLLQKLSGSAPEARLTHEAKAALERLSRRPAVRP